MTPGAILEKKTDRNEENMKEKITNLVKQAFKFGIVGALSTVIDFGLLFLLQSVVGINYLVASTASFMISLVFNYICSMKYVFVGKKDSSKIREFIIFLILSLIGLGLNEFFLWIFHGKGKINLMVAKLLATAIVMVWNFVSRKIFIEEKECERVGD